MARDETQAMSTERLAEIRQRADDPRNYYYSDGTDEDYLIERELLAELDRLRAREAALVEVVRAVADGMVMEINNRQIGEVVGEALLLPLQAHLKEQARALLASAGDGEQADNKQEQR